MKFYKAKQAEVGEGVEATVLYHRDNGDELICVKSGFESFEAQNQSAKEVTRDETDKLISKAKLKIAIPVKAEIRREKLSDEEILQEITDKSTPTVDIAKIEDKDAEGNPIQKLTYFEEKEIKSVDDFVKAQEAQVTDIQPIVIDEKPQETTL